MPDVRESEAKASNPTRVPPENRNRNFKESSKQYSLREALTEEKGGYKLPKFEIFCPKDLDLAHGTNDLKWRRRDLE